MNVAELHAHDVAASTISADAEANKNTQCLFRHPVVWVVFMLAIVMLAIVSASMHAAKASLQSRRIYRVLVVGYE